jgi:tetratricopeptide (TPR) repeat protein
LVLVAAAAAAFFWQRSETGPGDGDGPRPHAELAGAIERAKERFPQLQERRVVLLGMDSCDPGMLDRLIRQGKLKNFARLKREGAFGELKSIQPVLSPVIWTTIATGMTPERHGILDFVTETPKGIVPVSSRLRQADTIWELIARAGHKVGVVGWLVTYPADELQNAFIMSDRVGRLAFEYKKEDVRDATGKTWPADLYDRYAPERVEIEDMPPSMLRPFAEFTDQEYGDTYSQQFTIRHLLGNLRLCMATAETFRNVGKRLLREEKPRFFACYFEAMDALSHWFMPFTPPKMEQVSQEMFRRYSRTMEANYVWHDKVLGEFMELCDENTTLILVSDHGFRSGELRLPEPSDFRAKTGAKWHRNYGVIFAWGKGVKPGHQIRGANVYDVAPTILAAMGMPRSREMPGTVLGDIFEGGLEYEEVPSYYEESRREELVRAEASRSSDASDLSPEELAELQRLESLGYIGGATSDPATTSLNAASRMLLQRKFARALEEFEKVAKTQRSVRVLAGMCHALRELGRNDEAEAILAEMLEREPENTQVLLLKARFLELDGKVAEGEAVLRAIVKAEPHHYGALARLAANLLTQATTAEKAGDEQTALRLRVEALSFYDEALRREPLQPDILLKAARLRLSLEREVRKALEQLEKAIRLWPKHRKAYNNLAIAYMRLGMNAAGQGRQADADRHFQTALNATNEALKIFPRYAKAMANRAYVYWQMGRLDDALASALSAREVRPGYVFNEHFLTAMTQAGKPVPPPAPPPGGGPPESGTSKSGTSKSGTPEPGAPDGVR